MTKQKDTVKVLAHGCEIIGPWKGEYWYLDVKILVSECESTGPCM